jgi:hypothetical protein
MDDIVFVNLSIPGTSFLRRVACQFVSVLLLALSFVVGAVAFQVTPANSSGWDNDPATITRVRVILNQGGAPALEITSSHPLAPSISKEQNPPRLIVDLPDALMSVQSKKFDVQSDKISAVHFEQYRQSPPAVRVTIDFRQNPEYSTTTIGNQLTLRFAPPVEVANTNPPEVPSVPALSRGNEPVAVPVVPGADGGAVMLAGSRLANGASVTAGTETTVLRLTRGGELRVCPNSSVSVTSSKTGRNLMIGMNTGALEAHYSLGPSSDSVLTPDFQMMLAGPGEFHYAMSADTHGNTCVRALPGNTASVIVSELMGDGTYQVKPNEQVMFHGGKLAGMDNSVPITCGCPAPIPVQRASVPETPLVAEKDLPQSLRLAHPGDEPKPLPPANVSKGVPSNSPPPGQVTMSVTNPEAVLPGSKADDVHVQVEAPLVFRAADLPPAPPLAQAQRLPVTYSVPPPPPQAVVGPPPAQPAPKKSFMGRVKGFFSGIFH